MKEMELNVQEIRELMDAFRKNRLGSFKLEHGEFSLEFTGADAGTVVTLPAGIAMPAAAQAMPADEAELSGTVVKSPLVGTFYAAPAPDKDPFVRIGSQVRKGDILFIIESMKLMNEVASEYDGTVTDILVENAQGVEYGQPVLCIEPGL